MEFTWNVHTFLVLAARDVSGNGSWNLVILFTLPEGIFPCDMWWTHYGTSKRFLLASEVFVWLCIIDATLHFICSDCSVCNLLAASCERSSLRPHIQLVHTWAFDTWIRLKLWGVKIQMCHKMCFFLFLFFFRIKLAFKWNIFVFVFIVKEDWLMVPLNPLP